MADLTPTSPLPARLLGWMNERFPPAHGVLFFIMYATALLFGRSLATEGALALAPADLVGFAGAWSFFLMLRVFDEHKDFDLDLLNHPERVLQSGLVTLGHLKVLGVIAIGAQLGVSLWLDGGLGRTTALWAVVIGWSTLMAKEFFVGEWLEKRLVLYALSHMVVMPMALIWMAQMGAPAASLPLQVGLLAALSFLSGAAFEITRKAKGPEEERDSIRSYSQVWGTTGASVIVAVLLLGSLGVQALLLQGIFGQPHWGWYVGLAVPVLPALTTLHFFRVSPSVAGREKNEGAVSLAMLASYVVLIAALVAARGLAL